MTRTPIRTLVSRRAPAALLLLLLFRAAGASGGVLGAIPGDSVLVMRLEIKGNDPGQKWVFGELARFLAARAREKQESGTIGDVNLFNLSDFAFALLPRAPGDRDRLLLAATLAPGKGQFGLTYGDRTFQLNIRDGRTASGAQTALLSMILGLICEVRAGGAPEDGIYFNAERGKRGRFSAYYVSDSRAFLATERGLIASALAEKSGIASDRSFAGTMGLLPAGWDAYGFANDAAGGLSAYLRGKEKGWATLVLALLDPARRMGLALDIEDKDRCRAVAAFPLPGAAEVRALRRRLEPALSALLAEYLDASMRAELAFEELPLALRVTARLSNTAPFWEKAFSGKRGREKPEDIAELGAATAPGRPALGAD